jgi:HK97 family phage major capsid protein
MKINFPVTLTAADNRKRTISGTIVTWGEKGNTSAGATVFEKGSIDFSKPVKLLLEHDRTRPIGKLMDITADENGIEATFKIAGTIAGDDSLLEAAEGLRDGFSVGVMVDDWENKSGVMSISAAKLVEVSLVTDPAIDSARVAEVAATETPVENSEATATDEKPQEDTVSEIISEAPIASEAVEAAKAEPVAVSAATPVAYTKPRSPINSKATYLEHSVRAALGNDDSKLYVRAADDTTSNNAGLIPTRQLTEIINPLSNADRPAVDSVSRGVLPDAGMSFEIPKITAVPTVGEEAEEAAIDETGMTNSFLTVNVKKYAGAQTFSVELLDRSSPAFFDELVRQMEYAYVKATDVAVIAGLVAGGTDGGNRTLDAAGLLDFVSDGSVAIYKSTLGTATNILVSPEQYGAIMNLADNGRPIYQNLIGNQNQGANLTGQSLGGNLLGLNLRVARNLATAAPTGDNSLILINPDSYTWYESARTRLQTNVALNGQIEVAYYGYGALATKVGAGAYRFMVA